MSNEVSRNAFEAWAKAVVLDTALWGTSPDAYKSNTTNAVWDAWQASRKALESEQAQTVEPVAYLIDWPDEPELGHYFSESATESGRSTPLFTRPAPLPTEPTVKQPLPTERAEAIAHLRNHSSKLGNQAADMLEADAREVTRLRELARDAGNAATELQKQVLVLKAQQVAVPANKREPLSDEQIDAVTLAQWGEMQGYPLAAHRAYARAIEAKAQQVAVPSKREPLSSDEIAEWFVSENGLEDSKMCIYLDFEAVIRAVEARHSITPQGDKT